MGHSRSTYRDLPCGTHHKSSEQVPYLELPLGLGIIVTSTMAQRLLLKIRAQYYSHNKTPTPAFLRDGDSIMLSSLSPASV